MDLLLISPPVGNIGQASAGISVLTGFLRSRGWAVDQWDASLDGFHHFHAPAHLWACREALAEHGAGRELLDAASLAASGIEQAERELREPGTVADPAAMERAFTVLDSAGRTLTAMGDGRFKHTYRDFLLPEAFRDSASLEEGLADRANPYLAWSEDVAVPAILRRSPHAVGVSITYLSQVVPGFTLVRELKRAAPELPVAVGGGYLTALGEEAKAIPRAVLPADLVVAHDGEVALDEWLSRLGRRPAQPCDADLARVPSPLWEGDGLELSRYLVPRYAVPLPLTRGCHWGRCLYCNISAQTASSYRVRPEEKAIADIRAAMKSTGSNWFDFPVDSFRPDHLHGLARAVVAEGLDIRWAAEVVMDRHFTREVIRDLARSGCRCLRFGMESASAEVLSAMGKPRLPLVASRILRDCREEGIHTGAMLIVGYPTETQVQRMETFDFLVEHKDCVDFVALHEFNLVPGSPMASDPARYGLLPLPRRGVLQPSIPYRNLNQVGLDQDDVPEAASEMYEALKPSFPNLGKPWAVAIGGWMTFAWCCL